MLVLSVVLVFDGVLAANAVPGLEGVLLASGQAFGHCLSFFCVDLFVCLLLLKGRLPS